MHNEHATKHLATSKNVHIQTPSFQLMVRSRNHHPGSFTQFCHLQITAPELQTSTAILCPPTDTATASSTSMMKRKWRDPRCWWCHFCQLEFLFLNFLGGKEGAGCMVFFLSHWWIQWIMIHETVYLPRFTIKYHKIQLNVGQYTIYHATYGYVFLLFFVLFWFFGSWWTKKLLTRVFVTNAMVLFPSRDFRSGWDLFKHADSQKKSRFFIDSIYEIIFVMHLSQPFMRFWKPCASLTFDILFSQFYVCLTLPLHAYILFFSTYSSFLSSLSFESTQQW